MKRPLHALILAAGKGTRFKSDKVKVLHRLMGKSMIQIVLDSVSGLKPEQIHVVVGYQKNAVEAEISSDHIQCIDGYMGGTAHSSIRFSLSVHTTEKEIDIVIKKMPLIIERLREMPSF